LCYYRYGSTSGHAFASEWLGAIDEFSKDSNEEVDLDRIQKIGRSATENATGVLGGFRRVREDLHHVRAIHSLREFCLLFLLIYPPRGSDLSREARQPQKIRNVC